MNCKTIFIKANQPTNQPTHTHAQRAHKNEHILYIVAVVRFIFYFIFASYIRKKKFLAS